MFLSSFFFFFKQKTAYEMRISDWSSDVCSSDLDLEDLLHDLADDTPIGAVVVLPQWLSLLPVGLFFTSIGAFVLGALLGQAALVGFGGVCFLLSCLLFVAAPFMELLSSRRRAQPPRWVRPRSAARRVGKECVSTCISR